MDTLASLMEVKLDIREKRTEIPLRAWTRCYVKIEAIKSFPCYLKITFHKNVLQNEPGLVLRINIPGLEIYTVKSRTKSFAYGLYWKQNRKQCIAFLSLDSKLSMDAHMKWVEWQIQNLEQYRKELLATSRFSRMTQSFIDTEDSGIYQNMGDDNTSRMARDMNDFLGPLPNIPTTSTQESDKSWSRRMSGMSGIYEEIIDPCSRSKNAPRESAIYEEMKLNHQPVTSPPPLPPRQRKRLDTDCSNLQRSYTSPESDYLVNKKKWNIFDSMFGKGNKKSPVESRKKRNGEKVHLQPREVQLLKAKRNSFSSPDLTHLYNPTTGCTDSLNYSGCENCSFDQSNISSSNSYELENVCEEDDDDLSAAIENRINISQQIRPNFEPPTLNDMSRVNLVGSGYNLNESTSSPISPPGYLEMRPGKGFDMKKVEELDRQNQIQNDILYRLKYSFDSPITYKREFDYDSPSLPVRRSSSQQQTESHYMPMNVGTKFHQSSNNNSIEEHTYVPMNRCVVAPNLVVHPSPPQVQLIHHESLSSVQISNSTQSCNNGSFSLSSSPCESDSGVIRNKRHSVDDKIASYYPNYDVPSRLKSTTPSTSHFRSRTTESVVIVNGRKSKTPEPECKRTAAVNSEREKSCSVPIPIRKTKRFGSFNTKSHSLNDGNNNDGELSRKYATIARITSPNKYGCSDEDLTKFNLSPQIGTTKVKSGSVSPNSIKRFTTLSKLKKFDFSPLRLKITSVLQRHNSGSC